MAPQLGALRVAGLLLVLLAGPAAPAAYALPYAARYEPAPGESRAGSRAGEGRERPGRPATPAEETQDEPPEARDEAAPEDDTGAGDPDGPTGGDRSEAAVAPEPPRDTAGRSQPPDEGEQAVSRSVDTSEPVLRVLPLGSGLVLIGLGLGLAFLALRVRRG